MKHLYQLKIEISGSNPKIWRSILVAEETTFSELHDIIQLSMGWGNEHLYEFTIGNTRIYDFEGDVDDGADPTSRDSMDTFLNETVSMVKPKFSYVYDFGDHWKHDIQLEKVFPQEKEKNHPVCLDGENACPPEDCGGIWRYQDMLQIISDKNHPEFEEITDWMGEDWDAAFFDIKETNDLLLNNMEQLAEIYTKLAK
jgi:hypothetical protein